MEKVLVTGATGFIGLHCVKLLLEKGYKVRGTLRSLKRADEVINSMKTLNLDINNLELVEADLLEDKGWLEAMEDCKYVLHVASPTSSISDEDMVTAAVDGTKRVLHAAKNAKINKVVLTSSLAAVTGCDGEEREFNEADWTNPDDPRIDSYTKSKVCAELEAWKFVESAEHEDTFKLTVLIPSAVSGPMLTDDIGTSNQFILKLIDGSTKGIVNLNIAWIDVRDVANAHIKALKLENLNGERLILCNKSLWVNEIVNMLKIEGFKNLPKFKWPNFILKMLALKNQSYLDAKMIGKKRRVSNKKAQKLLGSEFISAEKSIIETANQLLGN